MSKTECITCPHYLPFIQCYPFSDGITILPAAQARNLEIVSCPVLFFIPCSYLLNIESLSLHPHCQHHLNFISLVLSKPVCV